MSSASLTSWSQFNSALLPRRTTKRRHSTQASLPREGELHPDRRRDGRPTPRRRATGRRDDAHRPCRGPDHRAGGGNGRRPRGHGMPEVGPGGARMVLGSVGAEGSQWHRGFSADRSRALRRGSARFRGIARVTVCALAPCASAPTERHRCVVARSACDGVRDGLGSLTASASCCSWAAVPNTMP